jgi:hypothetical protein
MENVLRPLHGLALILSLAPAITLPIVIRADVPDVRYVVPDSAFPALVDLPGEGHGTLIAPRWVVTAGHATQGHEIAEVWIHGKSRKVARVVPYPGFEEEYGSFREVVKGLTLETWPVVQSKLESMHDIALIELVEPVEDVEPVPLYRESDEEGKVVEIAGKGESGNSRDGEDFHAPHRGKLRRAFNRIIRAHDQWLDYRFDCGADALPLEGVMGNGDSGGPVLIQSNGRWELAGLANWKHWPEGHAEFTAGVCGQEYSNSRISYYAKWMDEVMASRSKPASATTLPDTPAARIDGASAAAP